MWYNKRKGRAVGQAMVRVNKVTVYIGERYEPTIITLYRTNTKLVELTNDQLEIPNIEDSKVDRQTYQQYCKDVVINLLENDGIEGYYYEPKQKAVTSTGEQVVRKFNSSTLRSEAINRLRMLLDNMIDGTNITYEINQFKDDGVDIKDRYKDMNIKFGTTQITIVLKGNKTEIVTVTVAVKSGQMCKPKEFTMTDGSIKQLNITTIQKILK